MIFKRFRRKPRRVRAPLTVAGLEPLEPRVMLSADIHPFNNRLLILGSNSVETTAVFAGQSVALQISAQNIGDASYNNKTVENIAWLEKDGDVSETEFMFTFFDEKSAGQTIVPFGIDFHTLTVVIPPTLAAGSYHIFSAWNTTNSIAENNNGNNSFVSDNAITVTSAFDEVTAALTDTFIAGALAGSKATVSVNVTNPATVPIAGRVFVSLFASLHNTLDGSEIPLGSGTLSPLHATTLLPGRPAKVTLSPTLPDTLAEGDYFILADVTIKPPVGEAVLIHQVLTIPQTLHVTAKPIFAVAAVDAEAAEAGDTGQFTVTRTNKLDSEATFAFTTGDAAKRGKDYVLTVGVPLGPGVPVLTLNKITLAANVASVDIFVNPIQDGLAEFTEGVALTLAPSPLLYALAALPADRTATVNITDDEPEISVVANPSAAAEGGSTGTFTITRTGDTALPLPITFKMLGAAAPTADYTLAGADSALVKLNSAVIPAGADHIDITLTAVDDALGEAVEHATLLLLASTAYHPLTAEGLPTATIDIADNDTHLAVAVIDGTASEAGAPADSGLLRITRSGGDLTKAVVLHVVTGGTAATSRYLLTAGGVLVAGNVTIAANEDHVDLAVVPIDDTIAQGDQNAVVTVTPDPKYFVDSGNNAAVQVIDDEPRVSIVAGDATALEPGTDTGSYTFTRTGSTALPLVVTFGLVAGTTAGKSDFVPFAKSNKVTILAGQSSVTIQLQPLSDHLIEAAERVVVAPIQQPDMRYSVNPIAPSATVTISDGAAVQGVDLVADLLDFVPQKFTVNGHVTPKPVKVTLLDQGTVHTGNFEVNLFFSKTGDVNDPAKILVGSQTNPFSKFKRNSFIATLAITPPLTADKIGSYYLVMQIITEAASGDVIAGNNVLVSLSPDFVIA
jgi:hypothetical protein